VAPGSGVKPQSRARSYSIQYADKDVFEVRAEYFYNGLDTATPLSIPASSSLIHNLWRPATFFYLGRHYVRCLQCPAPIHGTNTFTLSNLANLLTILASPGSITRSSCAPTCALSVHAVHWGNTHGEFRFGSDAMSLAACRFQP